MSTIDGLDEGRVARAGSCRRVTKETSIEASIVIDGSGSSEIDTMIPFFDHMLTQLSKHSSCDISISAKGDIEVDAHHLVEDVGIVLGTIFAEALGDKMGVSRFSSLTLPLDEALVEVSLDLSGRPYLYYGIDFPSSNPLGSPPFDPCLAEEFFRAFCFAGRFCLHLDLRRGKNAHHILEATFKGVARAILMAAARTSMGVPSTKGVLA
ncbi:MULTISPECIES: imidazoleglycerol-phosphate dehydratase HisB [Acidithrix]|uniref:Imidazoleglycerol-phosphate dehydratase n=1 Tax=Acidithrix ferrooxidans TaxID=1280514 RepID=A0A0D8HEW1_9ACTN|nr:MULTISPECIES: imidazoleglycerol-phosphate dehydratase HisB [Acidithrix]KJF16327.1 imidazoleglycerol-phosphate dehydratase [Acidithrix ferrooxidans]CAG4922764.1 unnamed protein product [Acidithrix sp. C25]